MTLLSAADPLMGRRPPFPSRREADRRQIVMRSATKILGRGQHRYYVLDEASMVFDSRHHYVVLGGQGAGKTTLLRLLSGMQKLGRGAIDRRCKVMPPLGVAHAYSDGATGRGLCKTFAQLYDANAREVIEFSLAFSGLGENFERLTQEMPADMRSRLSFAVGYAIPADFYLFDGYVATGSPAFRDRCQKAFEQRQLTSGTIYATRNLKTAESFGDRGVILHNAKLYEFSSVEEAVYSFHNLELEPLHGTLSYAEGLFAKGRLEEARAYLEDSGMVGPDNPAACELYAKLAAGLGDDPSAKSAALSALSADSSLSGPHLLLAQIAGRADDNRGAITHAETFLNHEPDHPEGLQLLAQAYEVDGAFGRAAAIWRALADTGRNAMASRLAARCELRAIGAELQARRWQAALALIENNPQAADEFSMLEMRAEAYGGLSQWPDLKATLREMIALDTERALGVVRKAILKLHADAIVDVLGTLSTEEIQQTSGSRQWNYISAQLLKAARLAKLDGFVETSDKLLAIVARVQSVRDAAPDR